MDATRRTSGRDWRVKINNRIPTDCFERAIRSKSIVQSSDVRFRRISRPVRTNAETKWKCARANARVDMEFHLDEATRRDSERSNDGNDEKNNRTKRTARKTSQSYLLRHRNASTVLTLWAPRNQSKSINPRANRGDQSAGASAVARRARERAFDGDGDDDACATRASFTRFVRGWDDPGRIRRSVIPVASVYAATTVRGCAQCSIIRRERTTTER